MAINIKLSGYKPLLSNELIYMRLENQTPLDFAVSYLESIESLFDFYSKFNMTNYQEFYNNDEYRINKELNPMRIKGYNAVTKAEDSLYAKDRARIWKTQSDYRISSDENIRLYK